MVVSVLEEMRIRSLGVIDDAVVELSPGFTAVTGETGAGKTMVVTSLGLLLGGRADPALVRIGAKAAVVEGRITVPADAPAAVRAQEAGAELDDGALLISRTVSAEGRSRAHLGGRSVPVGLLGELADDLVAVHGQTDQQGLLRPARQRRGHGLARVPVEGLPLPRGPEQPLLVGLAVDGDEVVGEFAEQPDGHGPPTEMGAGPPLGRDRTADQQG
ncbi:AAA family ATPase, partial [Streptomyces pathocidini]|uniref:AAA family ATPase n=1 Tax=Streptomyces pathocidini TaxID=1650571 RepID=UPI000A6C017E